MSVALTETEEAAWQALLHAHYKITSVLDAELRREHGLNLSDYDVLLRLANAADHRLRMSQIAERILISPSGVTRAVKGLEKDGLVVRSRNEQDARVVFAELTEKGMGRLRRAAHTHLRGIREHFSGRLTERQLKELASALQVITGPHKPH